MPTPGLFVLALQLEGERAPTRAAAGDFTDLILAASPVVKFVMALLLLFSVISWGIILYKAWAFRGIEKQTATFLEVFRKSTKFSEVQAVCPSLARSPLVGMFQAGYAELTAQLRLAQQPAASPGTPAPRPTLKSLTAVDRALLRASSIEVEQAGEARDVPGDHGQHHAVHRVVRHGVGNHDGVHEHRRAGLDGSGRGRAGRLPKR